MVKGSENPTVLTWMEFRDQHGCKPHYDASLLLHYMDTVVTALKEGNAHNDGAEKQRIGNVIKHIQRIRKTYIRQPRPRRENPGRPRGKAKPKPDFVREGSGRKRSPKASGSIEPLRSPKRPRNAYDVRSRSRA